MDSISAIGISKTFNRKRIFEDISITIHQSDRIAIIGENGVGKSTLMKILCGLELPDSGNLICDEWVERRYSAQEPVFEPEKSILDIIADLDRPDECLKIMGQLGFKTENGATLNLRMGVLSGGQRKILDIAYQFASSAAYIFIDEPENHLDIMARSELTKILKKYWGAVVFVSHDRYLINEIATKIIEIEDGQIRTVTGTYESYLEQRQQEIEAEARRWQAERKDIHRLENAVRILQLRARFNTKGSGVYQSRRRELERRRSEHGDKPTTDRKKIRLQSVDVERKGGKQIVVCEDLCFGYDNTSSLFKKTSLKMQFGERVALIGRNGSGKTSFLEILKGEKHPTQGFCRLGNNIRIEYFDQLSLLDTRTTALQIVEDELSCHESIARSLLANLLFEQSEVTLPISKLSGGQRNRIRIALLFAKSPEFVVLDEPTNNLDPTTWDILVEQIQKYKGTLLVVSHDRSFLENVGLDKYWVFTGRKIQEDHRELEDVLASLE